MRVSPWLLTTLLALTLGGFAFSCIKPSWHEGIACDGTSCPGNFTCCDGRCLQKCAAVVDDGGASGAGGADVPVVDAAAGDVAVGDVAAGDTEPSEADAGDAGPADGGPIDHPMIVICPAEAGGCFSCMPGCACSCGTATMCCLKLGFATCSTSCP